MPTGSTASQLEGWQGTSRVTDRKKSWYQGEGCPGKPCMGRRHTTGLKRASVKERLERMHNGEMSREPKCLSMALCTH